MGRPERIDWPGAYHHIYDRIIEKKYLLEDPHDKKMLFEIIKKYKKRHGFEIVEFVLNPPESIFIIKKMDISGG